MKHFLVAMSSIGAFLLVALVIGNVTDPETTAVDTPVTTTTEISEEDQFFNALSNSEYEEFYADEEEADLLEVAYGMCLILDHGATSKEVADLIFYNAVSWEARGAASTLTRVGVRVFCPEHEDTL